MYFYFLIYFLKKINTQSTVQAIHAQYSSLFHGPIGAITTERRLNYVSKIFPIIFYRWIIYFTGEINHVKLTIRMHSRKLLYPLGESCDQCYQFLTSICFVHESSWFDTVTLAVNIPSLAGMCSRVTRDAAVGKSGYSFGLPSPQLTLTFALRGKSSTVPSKPMLRTIFPESQRNTKNGISFLLLDLQSNKFAGHFKFILAIWSAAKEINISTNKDVSLCLNDQNTINKARSVFS